MYRRDAILAGGLTLAAISSRDHWYWLDAEESSFCKRSSVDW